jgi:general secretion pathway protein B
MSYILEALRKADAERERGSVPDLHAQLLPLSVSDAEVEPPRSALGLWVGLGIGLVASAGAAWWLFGRDEPAAHVPPTAAIAAAPLPAPPPAAVANPPTPTPTVPAVAVAPPQVPPAAPPEVPAPQPVAKPKPPAAASSPARAAQVPKPAASLPRAESPAPPVRVPPLAELPAELRQMVPPLVVGGSVYSPQASARMVVINGQVFQEGNSLGPELKLEQVRPKTAVFSIRGQRFELPL